MEKTSLKVRCQRIGCDATFSEDDNPDGSCRYHDSVTSGQTVLNMSWFFEFLPGFRIPQCVFSSVNTKAEEIHAEVQLSVEC
ncbi:hypothetical protein ACSQ67_014018 [Phaseolus vulgaris]